MTDQHEEVDLSPTREERDTSISGAYFGPGGAATLGQGVLYQGDYQNESDGTGIAVRLHSRALSAAGAPVLVKPFTAQVLKNGTFEPLWQAGVPDSVREEMGDLTNTSISSLFPAIRHFVVHKHEDVSRRLMRGVMGHLDDPEMVMKARKAVYGASVLFSVWERDRVDDATVRELNRMGDNWVPCEQNAEMLINSGVNPEKVFVVPHPYDSASPILHLVRRKPMTSKRFYWIGRWEPRKNPVMILEAFCNTFSPEDDVHLTMKYHGQWDDYATFDQTIDRILGGGKWTREQLHEKVTPIEGFIRPDQIVQLHFENNIYLSPSSGEAWCLPAFEAKLAGNLLIHTPYGGTEDFCGEEDFDINFEMARVPRTYGWTPGSAWAEPSQEHFEELLKSSSAPTEYKRPEGFQERFSMEAVGQRMVSRMREVWGEDIRW